MQADPASAVIIRNATESDAPAIARLVGQLGYPSSDAQIADRISRMRGSPEYAVWVAETEGRVVGLVGVFLHSALEYDGLHGRLLGLVVDEPYRGRGIGERMMAWTEGRLKQRGIDKLTLTSGRQRIEAHELYRRLGYEQPGLRFGKDL